MAPYSLPRRTLEKRPQTLLGYRSTFIASAAAEDVLRQGSIIDHHESPGNMIERIVKAIYAADSLFEDSRQSTTKFAEELGALLDEKTCVMSTPIMTNAGRRHERPLAACTVPSVDLSGNIAEIKEIVNRFHEDAIGTGFDLNDVPDPTETLKLLNNIAVAGARSGREDRPVGNMAVLSVHHPKILDFIYAKTDGDRAKQEWKFNISVDASDAFFVAAREGRSYQLSNGASLDAREVLDHITRSAHACGDPGLVFMDRMNSGNPAPGAGKYVSTAPCGEVGLSPGETCQFGYINLGTIALPGGRGVDFKKLERATRIMTRALDDCLEASLQRYAQEENRRVMRLKRKIGVGVCGLAELLFKLGLPYASAQGRAAMRNVIAFINYISKEESHRLAVERGSCLAMHLPSGCRYKDFPGFLEERYGSLDTPEISSDMWKDLARRIRETNLLRNISTTALPPTGRSGLVVDATPGVEPAFSLRQNGMPNDLHPLLLRALEQNGSATPETLSEARRSGAIGHLTIIPRKTRAIYATALEIDPHDHLLMVGAIQEAVDESVSKTVNLPEHALPHHIAKIYFRAHELGLKGITIFRAGSRTIQPRSLAKT